MHSLVQGFDTSALQNWLAKSNASLQPEVRLLYSLLQSTQPLLPWAYNVLYGGLTEQGPPMLG